MHWDSHGRAGVRVRAHLSVYVRVQLHYYLS